AAALAKLEGGTARLALLHHTCRAVAAGEDGLAPIEADSVEAGVTLSRWFGNEARRFYGVLAETDTQRAFRQLVELIVRRGGEITGRELQRANGHRYRTAEMAETALNGLVTAGLGYWRAAVFVLHSPTVRQSDNGSCSGMT